MHPIVAIDFLKCRASIIEASAGVGKTWTLERLYIKALIEAKSPTSSTTIGVDNILVVTFTNDAANELKSRIYERLEQSINFLICYHRDYDSFIINDEDSVFKEYLKERCDRGCFASDIGILNRALQNFDLAAIYTIHGFCNKIIHDFPFAAKVNPAFILVSSKRDLILTCIINFLRQNIINNQTQSKYAPTIINNLTQLFSDGDFSLTLAEKIANFLPDDLMILSTNGPKLKYQIDSNPSLNLLQNTSFTISEKITAKSQFLAFLALYVEREYQRLYDNNKLSYNELIEAVNQAVHTSSELANEIYCSLPVAFIDEFQDTDDLQWLIFRQIYHLDRENSRGYVVLVGDPKQAIYRFRGADIDTYIMAREKITHKLQLSNNFRAHPRILNFINQLFASTNQSKVVDLFGNGISYLNCDSGLANKEFVAAFDYTDANNQLVKLGIKEKLYQDEVQIVVINGAKKEEREKQILQALTFEILALLKIAPELINKIAILVTRNAEAVKIIDYLRNFGVLAKEINVGSIFATQTAHDLYLILSAILNLHNRSLFVQALSSKLLDIDLNNFLAEHHKNPLLLEWQQHFFMFKQIWQKSGVLALVYKLVMIINSKDYEQCQDVQNQNSKRINKQLVNRQLANIWQLAELINKQEQKEITKLELLMWFKQKLSHAKDSQADLSGNNEEMVRLDHDNEQIAITTQHSAKGLEFDIVFCPFFKSNISLNSADITKSLPFFGRFRQNELIKSKLITNEADAEIVLSHENSEIHRLNYVALTRAKQKLYIYLKEPSRDFRNRQKYNSREKGEKIAELFGFNKLDVNDTSHKLFNYPDFFTNNIKTAIKNPDILPGVISYSRDNLTTHDLQLLTMSTNDVNRRAIVDEEVLVNDDFSKLSCYHRQSYTSLTVRSHDFTEYDYCSENEQELAPNTYKYSILNDKTINAATFGILFHELCEKYQSDDFDLLEVMARYNINLNYASELAVMVEEVYNYNFFNIMTKHQPLSLKQIKQKISELRFSLHIKNTIDFKDQVWQLFKQYFGANHHFTLAVRSLNTISSGFLVGAIDLIFEDQGKYWVLDYKTNRLINYESFWQQANNGSDNEIFTSMAEHHYYLQYLLYLVALKRYLQFRLSIDDASYLLGGAVYFYVRGIYQDIENEGFGIYLDTDCVELVRALDQLIDH